MRSLVIIFISLIAIALGFIIAFSLFPSPSSQTRNSQAPPPVSTRLTTPKPTSDLHYPTIIYGKVVSIADGDTVTVLTQEQKQYRIRLSGIDAPESKQDFGQKSKQNLSDLIFGKDIKVNAVKLDQYGRTVGQIFLGDKDICLEQVKGGFAWHYKRYQEDQPEADRKIYSDAEIEARRAKRGLWLQANPIPPWIFRHPDTAK